MQPVELFWNRSVDSDCEVVRSALRDTGCVLLRQAILPHQCYRFEKMIEKSMAKVKEYVDRSERQPEEDREDRSPAMPVADSLSFNAKIGSLLPDWFEEINPGYSLYDLVALRELKLFRDCVFRGPYEPSPYSYARRVSPLEKDVDKGFQGPLDFHIDAQFHDPARFAINFWIPLTDCGTDAPGLQVLLMDIPAVQNYVYETTGGSGRLTGEELYNLNFDSLVSRYPADRVFRPQMEIGDVLVFHNWTVHATWNTESMVRPRIGAELRFRGDQASFPE